jgi:hypothetical protein
VGAVLEIARNFPHCIEHSDASFLGCLHERNIWDAEEYRKFESALKELARMYHGVNDLPREISWRVFRIFSHVMLLISAHYDPNDSYRVQNLTDAELSKWRERFQLVMLC